MLKKIDIKKFLVMMLSLTIVGTTVGGAVNGEYNSLNSVPRILENQEISDMVIVQIYEDRLSVLGGLIDYGITILDTRDSRIKALVTQEQMKWLYEAGFDPEIVHEDSSMMGGRNDFHDYQEMTSELQQIAFMHSNIARLYELGQSVQGRSIWGLKITDNPGMEENEPEVRICGCHHGNELMSLELPLLLAWHLVENYSVDPDITDLIDNREIWIIPLVNPDGRMASPPQRRNANNVDLNRDYGYMWGGSGGSPSPFSQPETQVIRDHALYNNFVLSLSFHTSGDIVNYIWNYKGEPVPDHDVVVLLSEQYGSHNGYWVVEGYDWYQTRGDTNDFSYGCRGDIDWTIEVQSSNIPQAWALNRDAMLEIIDATDMGLTGIVTDANTGQPIAATVWVEEVFWPCFTDPKVGDYHRVLLPGIYTVHFQANGYEEEIFTVEVIDSDDPTVFDVALNPSNDHYAYQVTLCNFYDPYGYPNNFQNNPTEAISALGPPDGVCASLGRGGMMVLDMGEDIINHEDAPDFKIYEGDGTPDGYHVRASQNWDGPWISIATGFGTTEFDLADGSMETARYIEIQDDYDGSPYETNPGVDIDAVQKLEPQNNPPNTPEMPDGPILVPADHGHEYSTSTTDPENHQVYYKWDWGDETSDWMGPYDSGEEATATHTWNNPGDYEVKVKAKDDPNGDGDLSDGLESSWSDPLMVQVVISGDLDGDGDVDLSDLAQLLANYGMTEGATYEQGDIDSDGDVDLSDLAALLANYGYGI